MKGWKAQKETKWVRASLEQEIEDIKNQWASGGMSYETTDETAQKSAEGIGMIMGLTYAIEFLTKVDHEEEEEDE